MTQRKWSMWIILAIAFVAFGLGGCKNRENVATYDEPSLKNLTKWKKYLQVRVAKPSEAIKTTQTQISNVSPKMAAAKIIQALESYDDMMTYRLSTVFQVAFKDKTEGEGSDIPAVTDVVVNGHYYYVAFLDYPGKANRASFKQTKGMIPAVAVVDAEDETKPAVIRTADATGKPYAIQIYMGEQEVHDPNNIYRFLRNKGFKTLVGSHRLDNPTLEFDNNWRPYFTATYCNDDGYGVYGEAYYPEKLLVVDVQKKELKTYNLDDPNTFAKNERASDIPKWVNQIYSPKLIKEWITHWGYNVDNYGKTSDLDNFIVDGGIIDTVMNAANTNLVFVSYITCKLEDNSTVGVMLVDPRTGKATYYPRQGTDRAMATKSAAINVIKQATIRWGYEPEDLTLHTIYGVPTWEGVLTRPAYNNKGREYGSLYAGTVLLQANYDLKPANVMWAQSKHQAFTMYEQHLYLRKTTRVGSNVLENKNAAGEVEMIEKIVLGGNTSYLIWLKGHKGKVWEVRLFYVGDPNNEDVLFTGIGDRIHMSYGDPRNRKTYIVKSIENHTVRYAGQE